MNHNPYCPPAGALQFEFDGRYPAAVVVKIPCAVKEAAVWVRPPIAYPMPCGCAKAFEVVVDGLLPANQDAIRRRLGSAPVYVCECSGRVIE
jgi:hypothetical protein